MRSSASAFRDHYAVLGVATDATEAEIKAAYRERAKQCHPDLHPGDAAAERFREISEARRVLLSPSSRAAFNLDRMEVQIVSVVQFRRPRPEPATKRDGEPEVGPVAPSRRARQGGGALLLAGILTVLAAVTLVPFVTIAGGPQPVDVSGFDGGALTGVLNSGACAILIVLGWAVWLGPRHPHRWEALMAFTSLWLLVITAAEFDPHILVGGFFSSDLGLALGARLLPVGVALTVCGGWLLRPAPRKTAASQPAGVAPETA